MSEAKIILDLYLNEGQVEVTAPSGHSVTTLFPAGADAKTLNELGSSMCSELAQELGVLEPLVHVHAHGEIFPMQLSASGNLQEVSESSAVPEVGFFPAIYDDPEEVDVSVEMLLEEEEEEEEEPAKVQPSRRNFLIGAGVATIGVGLGALGVASLFIKNDDAESELPVPLEVDSLSSNYEGVIPSGYSDQLAFTLETTNTLPVVTHDYLVAVQEKSLVAYDHSGKQVTEVPLETSVGTLYAATGLGPNWISAVGEEATYIADMAQGKIYRYSPSPTHHLSGVPIWQEGLALKVPTVSGELKDEQLPENTHVATIVSGQLWAIGKEKATIHKVGGDITVQIAPPDATAAYQGLLASTNEHLVLRYAKEQALVMEFADITDDAISNLRSLTTEESNSPIISDPVRNTVYAHKVLADLSTGKAMKVGTQGRYSAGFFFSTSSGKRISPDGHLEPWGQEEPIITDRFDNGPAIIFQTTEEHGRVYAFAPKQ